jgi:hypothetical protein
MLPIRAVWFGVGVLINETREYGTWADWLGIRWDRALLPLRGYPATAAVIAGSIGEL